MMENNPRKNEMERRRSVGPRARLEIPAGEVRDRRHEENRKEPLPPRLISA
jgi:hypothetical protein